MKIRQNPTFPSTIPELVRELGVLWRELSLALDTLSKSISDAVISGSTLTVKDEGTTVDANTTILNFTGAGVTATQTVSGTVEVAIAGAAAGDCCESDACYNTWIGTSALSSLQVGGCENTGLGYLALQDATTADGNTAVGVYALLDTTTGSYNCAVGYEAMAYNLTGSENTVMGYQAGKSISGSYNTAVGGYALFNLSTGTYNTAIGHSAGNGTSGGKNASVGAYAGGSLTTGYENVAVGYEALFTSEAGYRNVVSGMTAARDVTTGYNNVCIGYNTGRGITTGNSNTIIGAGITGLSSSLANNIILASGSTARATFDGTSWTFTGDKVNIVTSKTPSSASDTGVAGDICWDGSYIYVCTATNTWKRAAIATW